MHNKLATMVLIKHIYSLFFLTTVKLLQVKKYNINHESGFLIGTLCKRPKIFVPSVLKNFIDTF